MYGLVVVGVGLLEHVPDWHRQNLEAHLKEWR